MSKALVDSGEMQTIYDTAKDVYEGKYATKYALLTLEGKVTGTKSSLKMYFNIYSCMRTGKCYKMGTSESFTHFLLVSIFKDFGVEAFKTALSAAKGNSVYRESVNNAQPGIERACRDAISDCGVEIEYDDIPAAMIKPSIDDMEIHVASNAAREDVFIKEEKRTTPVVRIPADNVTAESGDVFELNIQPAASILNVFQD